MGKYLVFILIGLIGAVIGFATYRQAPAFLRDVDARLKDARFRARGAIHPDPRVVVVAIDNKSIKEIGRWPWPREVMGRLLEKIAADGARVTALDIVFSEPESTRQDRALADGAGRAGNVIMGYFFRNERQHIPPAALEQVASSRVKALKVDAGVTSVPLLEFPSLDANIPRIGRGALDFGFFNALSDPDGMFRRAPLLVLYDGDVYPSLALKALAHYTGNEAVVGVAPFGIRTLSLGRRTIPVNEHGELALDFYGPAGSFPLIPAVDILDGRLPPGALKNKLVFIGVTEIGVYDLRATPFDPALPGVELHATVAANTLEGRFLIRDDRTVALEIAAVIILPLLLGLLLGFAPTTLSGFGCAAAVAGGYLGLNYLAFTRFHLDMSVLYPLLPVALTSVTGEGYRNLVVERKGRYMKKAFSNYVSAELVAKIMKHPDALTLGGEKREITVLFSDIRGFTTLAESLPPEELVKLLNEYLSPMTRIVLEERGTLDKYVGDAIMAIYNAPLDVAGHPGHACRTAQRMIEGLEEINRGFEARGGKRIDIGIGINTGEAVVGNMGADIRFDYTAIGDNVNLASRLEGLTKVYGARVIVSESTRTLAPPDLVFREIDLVRVKGKLTPVPIYELMTERFECKSPFEEGLTLYRAGEFDRARQAFAAILGKWDDGPARLYLDRCAAFLAAPPPAGWDGVFVAETK